MFGLSRQEQFLKMMKQSGIPANGIVTGNVMKHPYPEEHRQEYTRIFGEREPELTIQITYKTQENTVETMDMHIDDLSAYPVGNPVKVRYLHENGHYLAIPEAMLCEKHSLRSSGISDRAKAEAVRKLRTVLLAALIFVFFFFATILCLLFCLKA